MANGMIAKLVWDGTDEVRIPSEMGTPRADQMLGTPAERLGELSGRVCYDSLGTGRPSFTSEVVTGADPNTGEQLLKEVQGYHDHILQVGHGSVMEHFHFTVGVPVKVLPFSGKMLGETSDVIRTLIADALNRPGVLLLTRKNEIRLTLNLRSVLEWAQWAGRLYGEKSHEASAIKMTAAATAYWATELAPHIVKATDVNKQDITLAALLAASVVEPESEHEKWISLFMSGSRGFCYDEETEVLTDEGWKAWPTVTGDEQFATLNPATGFMEYQSATNLIREDYSGDMYRLKSKMIDLLVTPNHRMYVRKHDTQAAKRGEEKFGIILAKDLRNKRVHYKRNAMWLGEEPEEIEIPDFDSEANVVNQTGACGIRTLTCVGRKVTTKVFAKFMGYWLAEGSLDHCDGGGYFTVLTQSMDSPIWEDMLQCVTELGLTYSIKPSGNSPDMRQIRVNGGRSLYEYLKPHSGVLTKSVPPELKNLSTELQRIMIAAYLAGDGSFPRRGSGEGHTVSRQLADDLQEAALKAGWSATIRPVDRRDEPPRLLRGQRIVHRHVIYVVSFCKVRNTPLVNHNKKRHDSLEHYSGRVYCVTVPNGLLYVRRNGRPAWSGNSHEQVRHGDFTAISQRSTRFVDESDAPWVEHPLLTAYLKDPANSEGTGGGPAGYLRRLGEAGTHSARLMYSATVERLLPWLEARGVDKTSARKQARGAARGFLGNALQTEMIFSASVAQWKVMLGQRATQFADAEIREVYAAECDCVLSALKESRYADSFANYTLEPSPDGIGKIAKTS